MSVIINPTKHQDVIWHHFSIVEKWQQLVYKYNALDYSIPDYTVEYYYKIAKQSNDEQLLEQVLNFLNVPRETLTLKERICYYELLKSNHISDN